MYSGIPLVITGVEEVALTGRAKLDKILQSIILFLTTF